MATPTTINRQEFLQLFGLGAAGLLASACLGGCGMSGSGAAPSPVSPPAAGTVDFTLDLTATANASLQDPAVGYVYGNGGSIIVAKTTAGGYVAFAAACTHQGTTVNFNTSQQRFICPNHNAVFNLSGGVVSGPAPSGLKQYTTALTGNSLRVTG